ncbi:RecX family transcriptional regulator [Oscillatoria laete-virens NRMC-F 0139]|jgi:regulatory protein|nr:RecX family transcriptional regulator [Oscillatoria laete-virens]MDL5054583.1 RecX family transcriptional regulator [Oscillatoria laete-virens NRMC-F 0139]
MSGGTITAIEVQKRNRKRVNVYIDDEYAFSLSLDEAAKLHRNQHLTDAEVQALRDGDEVQRATDAAAHFLASRPRSEREIRRRLSEKDFPEPVIEAALERLTTLGYVDDQAFAAFWVRDRMMFKPASPRALRYELKQKGVADSIIAEALADLDAEAAAYRAAESQAKRMRGAERRTVQDKLLGLLARRGFSYSTARSAVRQLMEDLEAASPDFFADPDAVSPFDDAPDEMPSSEDDAPFDDNV